MENDYRANRARFPQEELDNYRGQWVAFRANGSQIVAGAETVERLEDQLAATGEDPLQVVFEHVPGPEGTLDLDRAEFL